MMTKEQLEQYKELHKLFVAACKNAAPFISRVSELNGGDDICNAEEFWYDNDGYNEVYWSGGYHGWGEWVSESGCFDSKMLTMSNDELAEWEKTEIARIKAERAAEKERKRKISEAEKEQRERAELARLKAIYENNNTNTSENEQRD